MATAPIRHSPAPLSSPTSGSIDQRLAEIVGYINSLRSVATAPTVTQLTMTDELGQAWLVTVHSDGTLHTSLVPR